MFTVRVQEDEGRSVYLCRKYEVKELPGETKMLLTQPDGKLETVSLSNGAAAFVMNEAGATVDTIRTEKKEEPA